LGGVGGRPRVLRTIGPSSKRCKQWALLPLHQPLSKHRARLGRCIGAHRTIRPSSRRMRVGAARPKKRIFVIAITSRVQFPEDSAPPASGAQGNRQLMRSLAAGYWSAPGSRRRRLSVSSPANAQWSRPRADYRGRTAGTSGEQRIARDGLVGRVVGTSVFTKLLPKRESRDPIIHMASTKFGPIAISAMRASSATGLHREIFFGGGNLTNSSPGRNRSGSSLGTPA
jgi:hypothetical protein